MSTVSRAAASGTIRQDLTDAHRRAWRRIASPGTWFDGARRVAIAAETRNAQGCALCTRRKAALSPYAVDGTHGGLGDLPEDVVEVVHRVATDPSRLKESWVRGLLDGGMADTEYVETIGVVACVVAMDTFAHALGVEPAPLPGPVAGAPPRYRPAGAKPGPAWLPWIAPEDATGPEADLYPGSAAHIRRALSLVPDEARGFFDLVTHQYLPGPAMLDFANEYRAITHAQIELLAARVSAFNACFY